MRRVGFITSYTTDFDLQVPRLQIDFEKALAAAQWIKTWEEPYGALIQCDFSGLEGEVTIDFIHERLSAPDGPLGNVVRIRMITRRRGVIERVVERFACELGDLFEPPTIHEAKVGMIGQREDCDEDSKEADTSRKAQES
jgi:hypothetical protein